MAKYDYGLRGPRDTVGYDWQYAHSGLRYDREFDRGRMGSFPISHRITSPYNQDYVRDRGPVYPVNPYPYGGDNVRRMIGPDGYFSPYTTRAGTRTSRGAPQMGRYDRMDFGPNYQGRYPDEL